MSSEEETDCLVGPAPHEKLQLKKNKRTRQRVDAGEPRNSYASIPNFSSRPTLHVPNGGAKVLNELLSRQLRCSTSPPVPDLDMGSDSTVDSTDLKMNGGGTTPPNGSNGGSPLGGTGGGGGGGGGPVKLEPTSPPDCGVDQSHLLREILQGKKSGEALDGNGKNSPFSGTCNSIISQLLKSSAAVQPSGPNNGVGSIKEESHNDTGIMLQMLSDESDESDMGKAEGSSALTPVAISNAHTLIPTSKMNGGLGDGINGSSNTNGNGPNTIALPSLLPVANGQQSGSCAGDVVELKRARVENIVSCMRASPSRDGSCSAPQVNGCKKRKHYQPQQHETAATRHHATTDSDESPLKQRRVEREILRKQLREIQQQLVHMQQRYFELFETESSDSEVVGSSQSEDGHAELPGDRPGKLETTATVAEDVLLKAESPATTTSALTTNHTSAAAHAAFNGDLVVTEKPIHPPEFKGCPTDLDPAHFIDEARRLVSEQEKLAKEASNKFCDPVTESKFPFMTRLPPVLPLDVDGLAETLKSEITASLAILIDSILTRFVPRRGPTKPPLVDINVNKDALVGGLLDRRSPRTKVIDRGVGAGVVGATGGVLHERGVGGERTVGGGGSGGGGGGGNIGGAGGQGIGSMGSCMTSTTTTSLSSVSNNRINSNGFGSPNPYPENHLPKTNTSNAQNLASFFPSGKHSGLSLFNHHPSPPQVPLYGSHDPSEQNEALSLVVAPKKKRHKVTDTRITPRTVSRLLNQEPEGLKYPLVSTTTHPESPYHPPPLVPVSLPTSVAIPNPSLHQSDVFSAYSYYHHPRGVSPGEPLDDDPMLTQTTNLMHSSLLPPGQVSPDHMPLSHLKTENGDGSDCNSADVSFDGNGPISSTLTPMHLRKAKLMFFYVRYPSSSILKMYFPDIKFNKNNTAQLVKWFSNFREFYYIQMEKYARQALSEGAKTSDEINVGLDSELYRVLNLHYNRNNHIEVPSNFRYVVEQTLREFFKAIAGGKDQEQSWKKSIYKVIARLDDNLPEYFKSPNFLEQLE